MRLQPMLLDLGTCDSLRNYVFYGLHPGSFGIALLLQDTDMAMAKAHAALGSQCVQDMLSWTTLLPANTFGDYDTITRWIAHAGLESGDAGVLTLTKLSWNKSLFGSFPKGVVTRCGSFRKFGQS